MEADLTSYLRIHISLYFLWVTEGFIGSGQGAGEEFADNFRLHRLMLQHLAREMDSLEDQF
jgi:hypothetical protein